MSIIRPGAPHTVCGHSAPVVLRSGFDIHAELTRALPAGYGYTHVERTRTYDDHGDDLDAQARAPRHGLCAGRDRAPPLGQPWQGPVPHLARNGNEQDSL